MDFAGGSATCLSLVVVVFWGSLVGWWLFLFFGIVFFVEL